MAEAIETLAARLGQVQGQLQAQVQTAQAQQGRINQLESELSAARLETARSSDRDDRMIEALEKLGEKSHSAVDSKGVGKPFTF